MTSYLLIGDSKKLYIGLGCEGHNMSFSYKDQQMEKVFIHLLDLTTKDKYELALWLTEGECGSGWTTASWGHSSMNKVESFSNPTSYFCEPSIVEVEIGDEGCKVFLEDDEGVIIASSSYYGDDDYYPSGGYWFNSDFFTISPRAVDRMKVFVFSGPSAIGKSYLASNFKEEFKVYETDSSDQLPDNISSFDVVVLGNKYKFPELVDILKTTRDVVNVEFT